VIQLWRLTHAITATVLMLIASISMLSVIAAVPPAWPWLLAGWLILLAFCAWLVFWYPARAYRAWSYRIDERVLETHHGIWFRVIQLLPLSRLQHVDLHRGPLERSLGLATLILHTAGTHHAMLTVPGLAAEEAVRLRDHLVAAGGGDDAV
jgi:membrane protein YdbS with pleckstrin-like domain